MHVIVNWGGKVEYSLTRIYNLAQMMKNNGYQVALVERDTSRSRWLKEHLGESVIASAGNTHKFSKP